MAKAKLLRGPVWKIVLGIVCRTVGVGFEFDASRKEWTQWTQATLTTTTTTSLARLG